MKILPFILFLASSSAFAGDVSLQLGASQTSHDRDTSATAFLQFQGNAKPWGQKLWFKPVLTAGWIEGRSEEGFKNDAWVLGGGGRVYWNAGKPSKWFVEGQVLGSHGDTNALSGPVQFGTALGIEGDKWDFLVRHISNAGLEKPNRGETMLLLGYKF